MRILTAVRCHPFEDEIPKGNKSLAYANQLDDYNPNDIQS